MNQTRLERVALVPNPCLSALAQRALSPARRGRSRARTRARGDEQGDQQDEGGAHCAAIIREGLVNWRARCRPRLVRGFRRRFRERDDEADVVRQGRDGDVRGRVFDSARSARPATTHRETATRQTKDQT